MAYTTVDDPTIYFNTVLFTGTASGNKAVTGVGFQPDFVWTKNRVDAYGHNLYDSVRGTGKYLQSNGNSAESSSATSMVSFDSDGFTVGTGDNVQYSSNNGVSWNWKAGTAFSNDASATGIGSIDSSGSINTTAGFSIISWTGTGSAGTVAHGLGVQPQIVFVKNRSDTASWNVYTVIGGGGKGLFLNEQNGFDSDSSYFNDGTASTTTFPVGTANTANGSSDNMIAYCFANVKGYSKIFQYEGNSNSDGSFVYLGFRPAWLMVKPVDASDNWVMFDNKRHNAKNSSTAPYFFYANKTFAETTDTKLIDLLSNGFKIRSSGNTVNRSSTFIGIAFAESPFVNSNGIPNNAR
jgi:hypothetical protein